MTKMAKAETACQNIKNKISLLVGFIVVGSINIDKATIIEITQRRKS